MTYYDCFFYSEAQSGKLYQRRATGTPDVARLIHGDSDYWISPALPKAQKKKKLILADWSAEFWTEDKIANTRSAIEQLIYDGFDVYLWQSGQLKPLLKDELSCLDNSTVRAAMMPDDMDSISPAAAKQHHLSHDEIQVLDDYWVNHLLSKCRLLIPRSLSIQELSRVPATKQSIILNLIQKSKPPLDCLSFDSFSALTNLNSLYLSVKFCDKVMLTSYRHVKLEDPEIRAVQEKKPIILCEVTLELSQLTDVEELDVSETGIKAAELQLLLTAAPKIKKLDLSSCKGFMEIISLASGSLPQLEEVDLSASNINAAGLQALLQAAPNLKKINLTECKNIAGDITLGINSLTQLCKLDLTDSNVSSASIQTLLMAAPKLKELDLSSCTNVSGIITLAPGSLPQLLKMNLSVNKLTNSSILSLLNATSNLKILDFYSPKTTSDVLLMLAPGSLSQLEQIDLSMGMLTLTAKEFSSLIMAAPNLRTITAEMFEFIRVFTDDITLEAKSLLQLKEIRMPNSNITGAGVQTLLKAAPHLKILNLYNCRNLTEEISPAAGSLAHLEIIYLGNSNISASSLKALLKAAPNVKKLVLNSCINILSALRLARESLLHLEEIDLSNNNINLFDLRALISAASNLKKINFSSCLMNTSADLFFKDSLLHLEEADLSYNKISSMTLQSILEAAPGLKKLSIVGCKDLNENLFGHLKLSLESLPHLEKLDLSNSTIKSTSLNSLFAAAPKLKMCESTGPEGAIRLERPAPSVPMPTTHMPTGSEIVDAATTLDTNIRYRLNRVFYPLGHSTIPAPTTYRLDAFQTAMTNTSICTLENAFYMRKDGDLGLEPRVILKSAIETGPKKAGGQLFYGKQSLLLTNAWQALASLFPNEEMLRYNTTPATDVEIQYSTRDNLYYIRSRETQTVDIDFVIHVPDQPTLPADIKKIVDYFLSFTPGALEFDKPLYTLTGEDYFDAMCKQKKGACRHRAFAFKALMKLERPDLQVRIITNDCHSFVEVKVGDRWLRCDLGGYPAELVINESNNPDKEARKPVVTSTIPDVKLPVPPLVLKTPADFDRALQTWNSATSLTTIPKEFFQQCLAGEVKKRLIECATTQDTDALHYVLQAYCRSISRPVFYVNSAEDLICSAPYMHRRDDDKGELRRGPGGPLYEFLKLHSNGVILVNYGAFKADDIARFNTLLDKERKADGTDLPASTLVIGMLNLDTPNALPGSDFYSRFDVAEICPISSEHLTENMPELPPNYVIPSASEGPPDCGRVPNVEDPSLTLGMTCSALAITEVINLYHAPNWEQRLLGNWVPAEGTWRYETGELELAIRKGATTVEIQNGLWDNKDFCRFWREASQSGAIKHAGRTIEIPKGMTFVRRNGYDWPKLTPFFQQELSLSDTAHVVLNPATLGNFFGQYQITEEKQLSRLEGFIKAVRANEPPVLHVHLTRELSEDQWAMLLEECQGYEVTMKVYCAPGVQLPKTLQAETHPDPIPWYQTKPPATAVIQSTDVDTTVATLARKNPGSIVIDVSECHDSDLLVRTHGALINKKGEPLRFEFTETVCAVSRALDAGQSVILKGRCSVEIGDELAPYLLKRSTQSPPIGKLTIVSDDTSAFSYLASNKDLVSIDEKRIAVQANLSVPTTNIAATTATFMQNRIETINAALEHEPYIFLTGISGVGKTTFVTHELCKITNTLYQGEPALLSWALDTTPGKRKILFIDEANLSPSEWSAFEGLFNSPPGMLIDGEYCPLTPEHKVIFAGNPLNYGDERKLAPFFKRHGNAIIFEPLPSNVLYENTLKPLFKDTLLESKTADISKHLLEIYRFLCLCSETNLLISPRELQMIALLTISYCSRQETAQDAEAVTKYYAYHLTKHLVPEAKKDEFKSKFESRLTLTPNTPTATDFLITPSRQHASQMLDEFLALREIRNEAQDNEGQRYGGLGGVILEGEPGIGKSEMVIAALRTRGYEQMPGATERPYYQMPVSMSLAEKEELLRKAFNEGAVVVIDEINSSPMMERLLNALLMGITPEGTHPDHPGFLIIGTQNPITMSGRRSPSTALSRRTTTIQLPPYNAEEMHAILLTKGLPEDTAKALVQAYHTQSDYAKAQHLKPAPTFRDLLKLAEQIVCGHRETRISRYGLFSETARPECSEPLQAHIGL